MRKLQAVKRSGFTLIELLVVVGIILVLMALVFPALTGARQRRQVLLASKQVKEIAAAAAAYYEQLNQYPPDRQSYATGGEKSTDQYTLFNYLGRPVVDAKTGSVYGPYLIMPAGCIQVTGNNTMFVDPWGNPYEFDAVHVIVDPATGNVTRVGEPYSSGTLDADKRWDVKVWSWGPDKAMTNGSNTGKDKGSAPNDQDNITSWAD